MLVKGQAHPVLLAAATKMEQFLETYLPLAGHASQSDSPYETEQQAGLPRSKMPGVNESVLHHTRHAAQWKTWAGLDCVEGLMSCIHQVKSLVAVYPLSRTAIEGFAGAAWLLEPGIGAHVRAYRGLLDHERSLKAQLDTLRLRQQGYILLHGDPADAYSEAKALLASRLSCLRHDLESVRRQLPDPDNPEHYPTFTTIVDGALDDATEEGVGKGAYSELCNLVHPGTDAMSQLFNSGSTNEFLNISLRLWVVPMLTTCYAMRHCLMRRSFYYSLPSPEQHLESVLDALHEAGNLPQDTLLLESPSEPL